MDAVVAESGKNPVSKHHIQPNQVWSIRRLTRDGTTEFSREAECSGTNGDWGKNIYPSSPSLTKDDEQE